MASINNNKTTISYVAMAGIIAGIYAALTVFLAPISFGVLQFRVSEALTLLPVMLPTSIPGLTIGCFFGNLISGAPWQDILFGSIATFIAAVSTRFLRRHMWLAAFMPVLSNGLIVGAVLSFVNGIPFWSTAASVAIGEAAVCYMLGIPLIKLLKNHFKDEYLGG